MRPDFSANWPNWRTEPVRQAWRKSALWAGRGGWVVVVVVGGGMVGLLVVGAVVGWRDMVGGWVDVVAEVLVFDVCSVECVVGCIW